MKEIDLVFQQYYRPLCLYALHYLHDLDEAEDVVQDCFVRLLEAEKRDANSSVSSLSMSNPQNLKSFSLCFRSQCLHRQVAPKESYRSEHFSFRLVGYHL